jgi:hypothetical protein
MKDLFKLSLNLIILLLLTCRSENGFGGTGGEKETIKKVLDSSLVIQVSLQEEDGSQSWQTIGSATLIKDEHLGLAVITANHVAVSSPSFAFQACSIKEVSNCIKLNDFIMSSREDLGSDWAVYLIDGAPKDMKPARLSKKKMEIGDKFFQAGCPQGQIAYINRGSVAWTTEYLYIGNGFALPGSSGGGVFDEQGGLIGITVAMPVYNNLVGIPEAQENMPLIIPTHSIRIF